MVNRSQQMDSAGQWLSAQDTGQRLSAQDTGQRLSAQDTGQRLSALMDGHGELGDAEAACQAWRDDAGARERWHTYHLIGDVLRSDELAAAPSRYTAFVHALRERLAKEPVPLAPAPARSRWLMAPLAAAAGFVLVAGVLVIMRGATPAGTAVNGPVLAEAVRPDTVVVNGRLIRDARLDRYLAAHRQASNGAAVVVPGAVVRSVDAMVLENK